MPVLIDTPELSEQRWSEWVQKGRIGDAARVRRWRFITAGAILAISAAAGVYAVLFRT